MTELDTMQIWKGEVVRPCTIRNAYYRHELGADGNPRRFMSSLSYPLDEHGRLDGVTFIGCSFHFASPDPRSLGARVIG